jgi:VWFA-related protein
MEFRYPAKSLSITTLIFWAALLLVFTDMAIAQADVTSNLLDIHSAPSGDVKMVVSVLDEQGLPLRGLTKANFKLTVEGKEIRDFSIQPTSSAKTALSLILGIDVSGSMKGTPLAEAKRAASIFLDEIDKGNFLALMAFGSNVRFLTDFTENRHEVREAMESLSADDASTWLYQATYDSLEKASAAPTSRVAIVLLTDGRDEGSPRNQEDVLAKIRRIQVPVYTLGFGSKAEIDYLRKVATLSGGYFLFTPRAQELSGLYTTVLSQLRNQYLIEFHFDHPAGSYTSALTLIYRGKNIVARRAFFHSIPPEPPPTWKEWYKIPLVWVPVTVVILIAAAAAILLLTRRRPASPPAPEAKPTALMMIRGKTYLLGNPAVDPSNKETVLPPTPPGEVGLKIDLQPLPIYFPLIDTKNRRSFDEVVITRYDDECAFSNRKTYLLIPDKSVSRPGDEKPGHARIFLDENTRRYQIEDLGSIAGTKLNGVALGGAVLLANGDVIDVGGVPLAYYDHRQPGATKF